MPSGRVRDVPDLRTIRYYTTLGLLDRPAAMRGRTALYGSRHLLQLAAIKRLQARGLSLAAVQERVVGISDASLRRLVAAAAATAKADFAPDSVASGSRGIVLAHPAGIATRRDDGGKPGRARRSFAVRARAVIDGGTDTQRRRPPRDPHGGGTVDRNTEAARADRHRPHTTEERKRAMTTTGSKTLPLLDESYTSLWVADLATKTTPASASFLRLVVAYH